MAVVRRLEELTDRCQRVATQIRQRLTGEKITDKIVSLSDPDARPIRQGKVGKVSEFGYVSQLAEVTQRTRSGARGLILPGSHQTGDPSENTLLRAIVAQLSRLGITPREIALDGGFMPARRTPRSRAFSPRRCSSLAARSRLPSAPPGGCGYRTGEEDRVSHLKRRYGLDRYRLKGDEGRKIWTEWAILAYNTDTLTVRTR